MKKFLVLLGSAILMSATFTHSAQAQWYKSLGVNNLSELTENQLNIALVKAEKTATTGGVLTILGGLSALIGGIIYTSSFENMFGGGWNQFEDHLKSAGTGALVMDVGLGLTAAGIPVWIVGGKRKTEIKMALAEKTKTISLRPSIGKFGNQRNFGVSLCLTF